MAMKQKEKRWDFEREEKKMRSVSEAGKRVIQEELTR